jgi:hypothetical protein
MEQVVAFDDLRVRASDVTGQRSEPVPAPRHATVGEWVETLIARLGLKRKDADGNPYVYRPRLEREGRHLNSSEIVGEVLQEDDHVVLQPNVNAG